MGKLRNTLAAISILLLASCGGNKDYYMFTSFHEPADEGLRYLYSEDGRGFRLWLCKFQRLDSLVGATNDSCNGRRTDHCQCMGSGDFL